MKIVKDNSNKEIKVKCKFYKIKEESYGKL